MHFFRMEGSWSAFAAWGYCTVVADGAGPLYERFVDQAVLPIHQGSTVIDVGCGGGQVSRLIGIRQPTCQVIGLDLSHSMLRRARRQADLPANVVFRWADAMALPLEESSIDTAVCVASIKHWPNQLRGLREIERVLRPGGRLVILEADRRCTLEDARAFTAYWRYLLPGTRRLMAAYFRRFVAGQALDLQELGEALDRAGFLDLTLRQVEGFPFVVASAQRRARSEPNGSPSISA